MPLNFYTFKRKYRNNMILLKKIDMFVIILENRVINIPEPTFQIMA